MIFLSFFNLVTFIIRPQLCLTEPYPFCQLETRQIWLNPNEAYGDNGGYLLKYPDKTWVKRIPGNTTLVFRVTLVRYVEVCSNYRRLNHQVHWQVSIYTGFFWQSGWLFSFRRDFRFSDCQCRSFLVVEGNSTRRIHFFRFRGRKIFLRLLKSYTW